LLHLNPEIMTSNLPTANYYHVGLHKTGSTFLQVHIFPLFEDSIAYFQGKIATARFDISSFAKHLAGRPVFFANSSIAGDPLNFEPDAAARIAAQNPNAKVIISIRSQRTILRSLYWLCVKGGEKRSFDNFARGLLASSKLDYWQLVESYRQVLGEANVLVLLFEEFISNPELTIGRLAKFFDVPEPAFIRDAPQTRPTPGDLVIGTARRINTLPILANTDTEARVGPLVRQGVLATAYFGEAVYRQISGRTLRIFDVSALEADIAAACSSSNRRLFASMYETPYAISYPGMEASVAAETGTT